LSVGNSPCQSATLLVSRQLSLSVGNSPCQSATLLASRQLSLRVGNSPCQGTDVFTPDPGICQPPFTSYPPPPSRGRGGDDLPSCPLNMGRGGQGSATTCCFTWPLPPSICPPPSVVQGLCGEGDMGQTDFRDKGRRGGTQLLMQSPSRSSYIKSSQRSHSSPQSLQKAG
jgi:hypothetical protein